jgi:hypothetical protein
MESLHENVNELLGSIKDEEFIDDGGHISFSGTTVFYEVN